MKVWSPTSLKEKLIKAGAKQHGNGPSAAFQLAEVAIPRNHFADNLRMVGESRPPPLTSMTWAAHPRRIRKKSTGAPRLDDKKSDRLR